MKNNTIIYYIVPVLLLISACTSGVEGVPSSSSVGLESVNVPMTVGYLMPAKSDYNIELTLSNERIDSDLMLFETPVKVSFTVWGYDEMMADVAATKIITSEFSLRPQMAAYSLRFSKQEIDAIQYQSGAVEALKFYITLEVDTDDNGEVCNGDYRQNYTVSRPEFYSVMRTDIERNLAIVEIQGEVC